MLVDGAEHYVVLARHRGMWSSRREGLAMLGDCWAMPGRCLGGRSNWPIARENATAELPRRQRPGRGAGCDAQTQKKRQFPGDARSRANTYTTFSIEVRAVRRQFPSPRCLGEARPRTPRTPRYACAHPKTARDHSRPPRTAQEPPSNGDPIWGGRRRARDMSQSLASREWRLRSGHSGLGTPRSLGVWTQLTHAFRDMVNPSGLFFFASELR